jgi:hypothetical protein
MEKIELSFLNASEQKRLNRLYTFSRIMDAAYRIPFLKGRRWGIDGILGLLPGVGDTLSFLAAIYWVWSARTFHLPLRVHLVLIGRIILDYLIGLLPLIGDIIDIGYEVHVYNYKTVVKELQIRSEKNEQKLVRTDKPERLETE